MTWEQALAEAKSAGLSRCSDAAAMASFCDGTIQHVAGAVSGKLVWQGAMRKGLTYLQLATLCQEKPMDAAELMWV
jgi:hypothetical protein